MHEIRLQTYWADSDSAGIVYFSNFFRFIEQAEEQLYIQKGKKRQALLDQYGIWMPRVETHVNFFNPIPNGNAIRIRVDPQFKGEKTIRFEFEIVDDETSNRVAAGYVTIVCVDRANFKATPLPEEIRMTLSK